MIKNYFKIALRNLFRNKGFSVTNIAGLAIGMACTLFILIWVQDEKSYDTFHANFEQVHKVMANRNFNGEIFTDEAVVFPLAKAAETNFPQVKNAVVTSFNQPQVIAFGEKKINKTGYTVSDNYFKLFSWEFYQGNKGSALANSNSIVLTRATAKLLFGNEEAIGKTIRINNTRDAIVSAVLADIPSNSSMQFDFIQPFNYSDPFIQSATNEWVNCFSNVYIETKPGVNTGKLEQDINNLLRQHTGNKSAGQYFLHPMTHWRLFSDFKQGINTGGMIEYVRLFSIIALIILLIACVNFMNLSTARSEKRAKEVGIRKTLGSGKKELVMQFFLESIILSFFAFMIALLAVYFLMPAFNSLVGKNLVLPLQHTTFWIYSLGIILFTGIVAGSYPALYLSSFNAVTVLKGSFKAGSRAVVPRRILVSSQFVVSILLISATIIVYQQIQYVKSRDLGYNPSNLLFVPATGNLNNSYQVVKNQLLQTGMIHSVSRTTSPVTDIWNYSPAPDWEGKPADGNFIFAAMGADADFAKTMNIKIIEGTDFQGHASDSASILFNEAAIKSMGLKNPVGKTVRYRDQNLVIKGITSNVVMSSPFKPVDPMMTFYRPQNANFISIRFKEGTRIKEALQNLEMIFKNLNPAFPFEYKFADEEYGKKFATESLISKLTNLFALLAIFICCLGLAGLASFTIEKRTREIGVRKVLGASMQQLVMLISKEFLKLAAISFIIAVPLTTLIMNSWLKNYDYHISISAWLFVIVGILVLLLTLAVVGFNTIMAALNNPVKSLRTE